MNMNTTPQIRHLNALVEEFDAATFAHFDRLSEPLWLVHLCRIWPSTRLGLADELQAALNATGNASVEVP